MNAITLWGQTPNTLAANGIASVDTSRLQSHGKFGMYIDRIIFSGLSSTHEVLVELRLGNHWITQGFVPMGMFGSVTITEQTWNLPRPLYVPAGMVLTPRFFYEYLGSLSNPFDQPITTFQPAITYVGRNLISKEQIPPTVFMPWVSQYIGVRQGADSDNSERSTERHMVNPFDVPLFVQRFRGSITVDAHDATDGGTIENPTPAPELAINASQGLQYIMARMWDSLGNIVVRDPTPFGHLFHPARFEWMVNSILPPKGFHIIDIEKTSDPRWVSSVEEGDGYYKNRVYVTMIGYREVTL